MRAGGDRIHVVAGALYDERGRVLITQRPPGKVLAGRWEFPGGKLHDGEDAYDGLVRELREELGVEVRAAEPLMRYDVRPSRPHRDARHVDRDELDGQRVRARRSGVEVGRAGVARGRGHPRSRPADRRRIGRAHADAAELTA